MLRNSGGEYEVPFPSCSSAICWMAHRGIQNWKTQLLQVYWKGCKLDWYNSIHQDRGRRSETIRDMSFVASRALRINKNVTRYAKVTSWKEMKVWISPGHHKLATCNYETKLEEHLGYETWLILGEAGHKSDSCAFTVRSALLCPVLLLCVTGPAQLHRQWGAETCIAGAGDGKGSTGDGRGKCRQFSLGFSLGISTQLLQLGGAALLAWCLVEEMHILSLYMLVVVEE